MERIDFGHIPPEASSSHRPVDRRGGYSQNSVRTDLCHGRRCFEVMPDPFDRAERWRSRAAELRAVAEGMSEPMARESLLRIADSLLHHAANLETVSLKIRRARRWRGVTAKHAA
jgi:hypothetical protein